MSQFVCPSSGIYEKCKKCDHEKPHDHAARCDNPYCIEGGGGIATVGACCPVEAIQ